MKIQRKKKVKKPNLLKMPKHERVQLIKEVRTKIRRRMNEARFWRSMLEAENLSLNGQTISEDT